MWPWARHFPPLASVLLSMLRCMLWVGPAWAPESLLSTVYPLQVGVARQSQRASVGHGKNVRAGGPVGGVLRLRSKQRATGDHGVWASWSSSSEDGIPSRPSPRAHPPLGPRLKKSGCSPAPPLPWGKGNEARAREVGTSPVSYSYPRQALSPGSCLGIGAESGGVRGGAVFTS